MSYTPEQKGVLGLGQVQQLRHLGACAHMEPAEPVDTIKLVTKGKLNIISRTSAHRWLGRVVLCRIVIGCVDAWWVLHFALYDYISHWLRDALPVATGHMRVLKYVNEWHSEARNMPHLAV